MSVNDFLNRASKTKAKQAEVLEEDIEKPFVKYAKRKKCVALKLVLLNKRGFPDRTILCPEARIFFIEFKRKNKKQSPAQIIVMKLLIKFGFKYFICDEIGQAEKHLDEFLDDF